MSRPLLLALLVLLAGCGGSSSPPEIRGPVRFVPAPAAQVGAPVRVGASPSAVAVGFGAVWVANRGSDTVTRVDARTGRLAPRSARPPQTGRGPLAIAAGEGAVWVAAADGIVTRIDPARGKTRAVARVRNPGGIATGAGGVWVTSRSAGTLTRLDPVTGAPTGERPLEVGRGAGDVVVAGDSVWVANSTDGTVSRVDPETVEVQGEPIEVAEEQVLGLAAGDGVVWAAKTDDPQGTPIGLVRLDADDGEVASEVTPIVGGVPLELAAGLGAVWTTDPGSPLPGSKRPATVLRAGVGEEALLGRPIPIGANPSGIAVGEGAVWVTSEGDGTLTRIVPPPPA